jgi:hypothetical protein
MRVVNPCGIKAAVRYIQQCMLQSISSGWSLYKLPFYTNLINYNSYVESNAACLVNIY